MANPTAKQCFICGVTTTNTSYSFYDMKEIRDIYRVLTYKNCCSVCGKKANSFVNYWGKKKPRDRLALHGYLINGALPRRGFSSMMNRGYY